MADTKISKEKADQLLLVELESLPQNAIKQYLDTIHKGLSAGMSWKQITKFVNDTLGLDIKSAEIKKIYYEKYPKKEVKKQEKID